MRPRARTDRRADRAGLPLGGPLRRDASGGGAGVFVNGRELPSADVAQLRQLYGTVSRARYWLNAQQIAGYEGGPAQFNLPAAAAQAPGAAARLQLRHAGRHLMSDSNCLAYMHPNGSSVMGGNCRLLSSENSFAESRSATGPAADVETPVVKGTVNDAPGPLRPAGRAREEHRC